MRGLPHRITAPFGAGSQLNADAARAPCPVLEFSSRLHRASLAQVKPYSLLLTQGPDNQETFR